MTKGTVEHGVWAAFIYYEKLLITRGFKPVDHTDNDEKALHPEHLLWMCQEMGKRMAMNNSSYPMDKASRWLGYVQAGLIASRFTTIKAERDRTRIWKKE